MRVCLAQREAVIVAAVLATLCVLVILVLRWTHSPGDPTVASDTSDALSALLSVQVGIASIALPVVVFVIESARDGRDEAAFSSHEVLLRETLIVPILCAALSGLLAMSLSVATGSQAADVWVFSAVVCLSLAATLYTFYRATSLMSSRPRMEAASFSLWREKMRLEVHDSVIEQRCNQRLPSVLTELDMSFSQYEWLVDDSNEYFAVKSLRSGVLLDIDLNRLQDLAAFVNACALRSDASLAALTQLELNTRNEPRVLTPAQWTAAIGVSVDTDTPILRLKRRDYDVLQSEQIGAALSAAMVVGESTTPLEAELCHLKDQVLSAIRSGLRHSVSRNCDLYSLLVREYMNAVRTLSAAPPQTETAAQDLSGVLAWIDRDIADIVDEAVREGSAHYSRVVVTLIYSLVIASANTRDWHVFRRMVGLLEVLYISALRSKSMHADDICGAIAFRLEEICNAWLAGTLRRAKGATEVAFAEQCMSHVVTMLMRLMKRAVDDREVGHYAEFARALDGAFARH